jgi:hypothetical protein
MLKAPSPGGSRQQQETKKADAPIEPAGFFGASAY